MDELDNDKSDSNESISTHFTPSAACKKKRKPRGPYNQYLSQPGAKIPRTTLKKWPDKSTAIASISAGDLCSTSSQTRSWKLRSGTACSGSSTNTNTETREQLQNTPQLIYMSLNKNSVYCVMPRSSKPTDTCK